MSKTKTGFSWWLLCIPIIIFVLGTAVGVWALFIAFYPLNLDTISKAHPPIHDTSARTPMSGCGLNEIVVSEGCAPFPTTSIVHKEVTFPSRLTHKKLLRLKGTLSFPKTATSSPRPGVVLVHGSGPNSRDSPSQGDLLTRYKETFNIFEALAQELNAQGFVVLRYDKRSSPAYRDEFKLDPATFEFSDFIADARDGLDFLANQPEVNKDALVVIGHSQGGQLAPHIASGDPRIKAVVMLAGTTQLFETVVTEQLERLAQIYIDHKWDFLTAWILRNQAKQLGSCFERLRTDYQPDEQCLGGGVTQRALKNYEALGATTPKVLASLHCPVMVLQGSVDRNIDPLEVPRIQTLLKGRDAEYHYIPGVDHPLTNALTPTQPPSFDSTLLKRVHSFLGSVSP